MEFLDKLPYPGLTVFAIILAILPINPMPHLIEKLIMLKNGTLTKPIDIFDLIMHSTPLLILGAKLIKDFMLKN